jgi:hypothetical protein
VQLPETNCARARESVSAQLDGELLDLDLTRLEAHLLICPDCSVWAGRVRDATAQLRATSLEEPAVRLVLPRHGRSWRVSSAVAVASAAAVVATMFFAPGQQGSARNRVSGLPFASAGRQQVMVPRLSRIEDGLYAPAASTPSQTTLRVV